MKYRTYLENGGIELAHRIVEANLTAENDADLLNRFAQIREYALAVLRDAEKEGKG